MWLLSTSRAEIKFFPSLQSVPRGYAILSHVWDESEQSFQDLQNLRAECALTGKNPRDCAGDKIRNFCQLAESHGYAWGWADTCCIDKTSSAELSEAINSMFDYYSQASVCYAYLRDVPSEDDMDRRSAFGRSRWHRRGWTLQELVAPSFLVFLSQDWRVQGTKYDLAVELEVITRVPASVLRMEEAVMDISVARRMSWAAKRKTTRLEDIAYCLMGIFGINMPTLYGEGKQAFRRLQEEIMKTSIDTSLFAWFGTSRPDIEMSNALSFLDEAQRNPQNVIHEHHISPSYLLASSPYDFRGCADVSFEPPSSVLATSSTEHSDLTALSANVTPLPSRSVGIPTFSITSYGTYAHLPAFETCRVVIAVLFCVKRTPGSGGRSQHLGLILTPCPNAADPCRPLYHCGISLHRSSLAWAADPTARIVRLEVDNTLDDIQSFNNRSVTTKWRGVHITHWPPPTSTPTVAGIMQIASHRSLLLPFRLSEETVRKLNRIGWNLSFATAVDLPWSGSPPVAFTFKARHHAAAPKIRISLGRCPDTVQWPGAVNPLWSRLEILYRDRVRTQSTHDCPADHLREWTTPSTRIIDTVLPIAPRGGYDIPGPYPPLSRCFFTFSVTPWAMHPGTMIADVDIYVGAGEERLSARPGPEG